jgi:SdrD B-like protein
MSRHLIRIIACALAVTAAACGRSEPEQTSGTPAATTQATAPPSSPLSPPISSAAASGSPVVVGLVFEDKNRNGAYDGGDDRMPGQTVLITNLPATQIIKSMMTDSTGNFRVDGLKDGEYRISVQIPAGFTRTNDDSFNVKIAASQPAPQVLFGIRRN